MFANSNTEQINNSNIIFNFFKAIIISLVISLGLVVTFALILKWFDLSENLITPITFAIKYISVIAGSLVAVRGENKGLIKGAIFGAFYTCFAFLVFSFLSKTFTFDLTTLLDFVSSILIGAIIGIIKVNRK